MSKYNATKFYWLQLKEEFFEDDAIQWLEDQKPNGREYAYFYLKLCAKALKTNGVLIRKVGDIFIPYDIQKLSELTRTDYDTVAVAIDLLKNIGLISVLENGEIYIKQLENLIGSTSISAFKKQQQRLLSGQKVDEGWTEGGHLSTKDKDKDKDKIKKNIYSCQNSKTNFDESETKPKIDFENFIEIYNSTCTNLPKIQKLTDKRKTAIKKFLKEFTIDQFKEMCQKANASDFLIGKNKNKWKADFDFIMRTDKATQILEGRYTTEREQVSQGGMSDSWKAFFRDIEEQERKENINDTSRIL